MNRFTLVRLPTVKAARGRVQDDPQARLFRAGGIDLLDRMKEGLDAPDELVELAALRDDPNNGLSLRAIERRDDGSTHLGALVTLSALAEDGALSRQHAALAMAAGSAATPSIRNGATLGGNLLQRPRCWYYRHKDMLCLKKGGYECLALTGNNRYNAILGGGPSFIVHPSSLASALVALDATVETIGDDGPRTRPITELFALPTQDPQREHVLEPGELLTAVHLPAAPGEQRSIYLAVKEKQSHDWPLVEASVRCRLEGGKLTDVRVALGHVAPIPWRSEQAEAALEGKAPSADLFAEAARAATFEAKPLSHNAYKVPMVQGLLRQALHLATDLPLPE